MRKKFFCFLSFGLAAVFSFGQDAPNLANGTQLSPNTAAAGKMSSSQVNHFTGTMGVSIPIYSYSDNSGLSLSISAQHSGGGIRTSEQSSIIGMGWYLNTGGSITRIVRGIPDDVPTYGFMYAAAIPTDFRSNGDKYYFDSLDTQQDIFQFSVNGRSGKFVIGKNKQIVLIPESKIKIQYTAQANQKITSFKITTEDGVKYIFDKGEMTAHHIDTYGDTYFKSQYSGYPHYGAWQLTQIISPFYTDTIKFTYTTKSLNTGFAYPQAIFVRNSDKVVTATFDATGTNTSSINRLTKITFPDKKQVDFIYSDAFKYDDTDNALSKIKISDTVFRYGYAFDYQTWYTGRGINFYGDSVDFDYPTNLLLKSITPYTLKEADKSYQFVYNTPYPNYHDHAFGNNDSVNNGYDHWGYFNGRNNSTKSIPHRYRDL